MDYQNGTYGRPPYDEDPNSAGQDPNAPRAYREDPSAYGTDPASYGQQSAGPYGAPYDQNSNVSYGQDAGANYGQDAGYGAAYGQDAGAYQQPASYDRDYTARHPRTNYGDVDTGYSQQSSYEYPAGNESASPRSDAYGSQTSYGQAPSDDGYTARSTGRYQVDPNDAYASSQRSPSGSDGYGQYETGRTNVPRDPDGYGYITRSSTGRTTYSQDGDYDSRGNTSRTRYPQHAGGDDDDFLDREPRAPRSGKKKRSKFGKFMHALGLYLAQLPAKTLVIYGGTFAMALVAVILLAVLLPNSSRTERDVSNGELAITDTTPTPSLAPTNTPAPTAADSPTPEVAVLTENISKAGTVSDLIPDIQKRLVELGYMEEPDGGYTTKFGPATKTAIRLFQMKNFDDSANWDGIIGNTTYALLMSDDAKAYYLTRGDGDDRTKIITKLVEDVTDLQTRLIELGYLTPGSATGLYGATTVEAVQKFQEYNGLSPIDGKAGQETLALIYTDAAMDAETGKANNLSKATTAPSASADVTTTTTTTDTTTTPNP